jgi:hypothetical protein
LVRAHRFYLTRAEVKKSAGILEAASRDLERSYRTSWRQTLKHARPHCHRSGITFDTIVMEKGENQQPEPPAEPGQRSNDAPAPDSAPKRVGGTDTASKQPLPTQAHVEPGEGGN